MTDCDQLDDYRWLTGGSAARYLRDALQHAGSPLSLVNALRRDLSARRARLVVEQAELRRRAAVKFQRADEMFFTRQWLEQATDEVIAAYKADRFPPRRRVTDLCCGIGGDLLALSAVNECRGVDRDPLAALLAAANCASAGRRTPVTVADVTDSGTAEGDFWHIDPDRRAGGRRVTRIDAYQPDVQWLRQFTRRSPRGAMKLAPATELPDDWIEVEREWIGSRGECRQQVAWHGDLARGQLSTATVVRGSEGAHRISGRPHLEIHRVARPGRFVYEPHAAILAAGLEGELATRHELAQFSRTTGYLTADQPRWDALMAGFEVLEVMPLDARRMAAMLRGRGIGSLEIKHRGLPLDLKRLRRRLKPRGSGRGTLLLAVERGRSIAMLARPLQL